MHIEAVTIAQKIAASLVEMPDTPPLLTTLQKKIPEGAPNNYRIADLTDDDVLLLRKIWAGLPIPGALNMTREQFALCKKTFEESPDRPGWGLYVEFRDYRAEAKAERIKIQNSHLAQIETKAKQGQIELLTAHRIPTDKMEPGTLISIEDARAYMEGLSVDSSWLDPLPESVKEGICEMEAERIPGVSEEQWAKYEALWEILENCQINHTPAPLPDNMGRPSTETRLSKYLKLDTWTIEQAACLVSGIEPETMRYLIPGNHDIAYLEAYSLSGMFLTGGKAVIPERPRGRTLGQEATTSFLKRSRVLELWNSQMPPPG